jgi:hypothetical protein
MHLQPTGTVVPFAGQYSGHHHGRQWVGEGGNAVSNNPSLPRPAGHPRLIAATMAESENQGTMLNGEMWCDWLFYVRALSC